MPSREENSPVIDFIRDATQLRFLQHALLTGVLASIACGVIGSYVVTRRITYIAGAIAHSVLGGMGAARYLQVVFGWTWATPFTGAVVAALVSALIIGLVNLKARQREDTIIGAVWAVGMAIGIMFIFRTPGYNADLMSYLFGNILMVTPGELWMIAALDAVVVGVSLVFYNQLLAVCFDEEFARLRGINVEFFHLLLLCLTALTVVLLVTVVGIVLVIALLTLPAAAAGHFTRKLSHMMVLAAGLTLLFTTGGLSLSYVPDLPPGATIVILSGACYLAVTFYSALIRKWRV